ERTRQKVQAGDQWASWQPLNGRLLRREVLAARDVCRELPGSTMWSAYGGYYLSPHQAAMFDALRSSLPKDPDERRLGLGALIVAAARCVASPGHTAQPFRPTPGG